MIFFHKTVLSTWLTGVFLLSACVTQKQEPTPDPFTFTLLMEQKSEPLFPERANGSPALKFDISIETMDPAFGGIDYSWLNQIIITRAFGRKYNSTVPRAAVDLFIKNESNSYKKEWKNIFAEVGETPSAENFITLKARKIEFLSDNIMTYEIERYEFRGGAHGLSTKFFLNIDLKAKRQLKLNDIFKDDYRFQLAELLVKQSLVNENLISQEELAKKYTPIPTENFVIQSDGILFYYNPYDIAPYAYGAISVKLSYEKLRPLLRERFVK